MTRLHNIPGVLIHGKLDISGPAAMAWQLHKRWPTSQLILINDEGRGGPKMIERWLMRLPNFWGVVTGACRRLIGRLIDGGEPDRFCPALSCAGKRQNGWPARSSIPRTCSCG
jgi:hypothetical protein